MTSTIHLTTYLPEEFSPIRWTNNQLKLLDQRILPLDITWLTYSSAETVAQAITDMVVRGAPAIGITAAYGVVLSAIEHNRSILDGDYSAVMKDINILAQSRPTAINLFWALEQMEQVLKTSESADTIERLIQAAIEIHQQDIQFCHQIGDHGAGLLSPNSTVYTHCNAGALATGGHGTALGVIRTAFKKDKIKQVFAGETRPWLQGARLTSWELTQAGIPATLVTEGAAGHTMKSNPVDWVIVGADRISADGSAANKIGTYNLAVLAKFHGCKVMVAAPSSTFDMTIDSGLDIPIEQRPFTEVTQYKDHQIAPTDVIASNPSFDVTPPELIDAIVTEKGVILSPTKEKLLAHFQ